MMVSYNNLLLNSTKKSPPLNKGTNKIRGTTRIQEHITVFSLKTSDKVPTDNAVLRFALHIYSIYTSHEKLGDELSIQCSMLTHTNRQLSLPVHLHLVPVNVFKGIHLLILLYIYTHSLSRKLF